MTAPITDVPMPYGAPLSLHPSHRPNFLGGGVA